MAASRLIRSACAAAALILVAFACVLGVAATPARASEVFTYTEGLSYAPFSFPALDPALTTGPAGDQRLQFVLPVSGAMPATAVATAGPFDFGKPSIDKEFLSVSWSSTVPRGGNLFVSYSVDGRAWLPAIGDLGFDIPDGTHGRTIAYRVSLTTSDPDSSPVLRSVTIEYARWTGDPTKPPPGGGGGGSHQPGATHKPGSGSYTYPPTGGSTSAPGWSSGGYGGAPGGPVHGGGGSGSGAGGSGGAGSGSGGAGAAASQQPPAVQATAQPSSQIPAPPASSPVGPARSVSGLLVDPEAPTVTGVPLETVSAGGLAGGGETPVAASGESPFPYRRAAAVSATLAALLFVPWLISAAGLRRITGHDFEHARLWGPFGLLRR